MFIRTSRYTITNECYVTLLGENKMTHRHEVPVYMYYRYVYILLLSINTAVTKLMPTNIYSTTTTNATSHSHFSP